ncbi:hypothetical protein [Staphylococcus americanisciuri]|uniref:Phage protein n=1 Tax=Staphylococcus americanisciuri TaxID=2973940 RepID=A0ABT2F1N9_9STAP|nr:hypothetical protein [Staphylococcus americanisciuri]MCS4486351.1 hypothetical protein [Staphylococcus americanisciuri]
MNREEFQEKVFKINKELETLLTEFNEENGEAPMIIFAAGIEDDYEAFHCASVVYGSPVGLSLLLSDVNGELTEAVAKNID